AQRRAGISDGEITAAMEEKLKVNMARQWPEPKDGEPRLHIKEQPAPVVPESISVRQAISALESADCVTTIGQAYKMGWNACRAAMLQGVEQPQNARQNIPENIPDGNSPAIPDDWVSCSERMPDSKTGVLVAREFDRKGDWRMKWATYIPGHPDANDGWIIPGASWIPSHWMPLPEPPQEEK
ncbi:dATP/dGTP pyrophosphohydrolase domain-containing protein, partial [Salmonella enterica]|uniref:dATP/dGTP pyrophosphohydrolase domain-containing protein n=1 Tax=Salmonella enterica TaxID=28901 RepID=UPI000AED1C5F